MIKTFLIIAVLVSIAWISLDKIVGIAKTEVAKIEFKIDKISRELNIDNY